MNPLNTESTQRTPLRTSDLAAATSRPTVRKETEADRDDRDVVQSSDAAESAAGSPERLEPLFSTDLAGEFRTRWTAVQGSFVDDPRDAVRQGDELVAQVMKSLAESFAAERDNLEQQVRDGGEASTETLRVALRRYRSFFERLLSL